jgi:RNA-directed DNA polymerase
MQTSLQGIAEKAKRQRRYRFQNLSAMLNEEYLHKCWKEIRKEAAYGVDRISAEQYEQKLTENIRDLIVRLKENRYHAKLVRRQYIPKENGKQRPLGIPAVEDKLLQLAVARILEAIYEQDFLECSYGYRPNRGVHDAIESLSRELQFGAYRWIVEADIQGYFDNVDHDWLEKMLQQRIDDRRFTRLIRKWLRAGVLQTDGKVLHPQTGTPQGGVVSPVLANIYLHYVLDLWFEKIFKRSCQRKAYLIRYADDFVCAFEREEEAKRFREELDQRIGKFGLKLAEDKTRVMKFVRGDKESGQFDFLGFEFRWEKNRNGKDRVRRRTSRKKLRSALKRFSVWCQANQHVKLKDLFSAMNRKLRGYYNHYGVIGNYNSLAEFYYHAQRALYRRLNRRSQRRSVNWQEFSQLVKRFGMLRPYIYHKPIARQLLLR